MSEPGPVRPLAFLGVAALGMAALTVLVVLDGRDDPLARKALREGVELTEALGITDLALWSEARYTRHPSQADRFTAFQSAPSAPDHFLSGTWVPPPLR